MKLTTGIALVSLAAGALSCTDATTTPLNQLNLERPIDIAFACWGPLRITNGGAIEPMQAVVNSPQPVESCNVRSGPHASNQPEPRPPGQEDTDGQKLGSAFWYALILQSEPGTIAIARFEAKPSASFAGGEVTMLDADSLTPGKNGISVGEDPVAISMDKVGCYAVTANAGSCDLSVLDVNTVVRNAEENVDAPDPTAKRMDVTLNGTPLRAKPSAMVFEPAGGTIGVACPADPTGLVYIAYPSCHLVAGVNVATGAVSTAISFDAAGLATVVTDLSTITCADECGASMAPTPGPRPVTLALENDTRTGSAVLAIGADNSDVLTTFELDTTTFEPVSQKTPVTFENTTGRLGITSVAISPVIGMGGTAGIVDDETSFAQHRFVYAVATDGTVRVADISGAPRECDTQVDPRFLHDVRDIEQLACFTVGDAATPPRRALARSPGIQLIGDAIPTSGAFVTSTTSQDITTGSPTRLIGHFAAITAANGQTYIANVDNDDFADFEPPGVGGGIAAPIPLDIAHQLRDAVKDRGALAQVVENNDAKFVCDDPGPDPDSQGGNSGGPRAVASPALNVPVGSIAIEKTGGLPSIRQVRCVSESDKEMPREKPVSELSFSAPLEVRELEFPDLMGLRTDEVWTLTWEGGVSLDKVDAAVDGPATRVGQLFVDGNGLRLADASRPFCDAGVEPNDILQLRGCDPSIGDAGCPIGYTCYVHPQSQVAGLGACMLVDEAERLANTCSAFLRSQRRYTIKTTKTGELQLLPRKVELRTTPLDGCTDDAQCESLADYALKNQSAAHPIDDRSGSDPKTWTCQADPDRAPKGTGGTGKRCLLVCDTDADCSLGTVCHANTGAAPKAGYCMEGVIPPQSCVNGPQRYEMRVGEAFAVLGSRQGFIHPIIADAGGNCVRDPDANPFQIGRMPLSAPDCVAGADPRTGQLPGGGFEPNPCKTKVDETEFQLNYVAGTCTLGSPDETLVTRQADAIQLRNRALKLTVVDPTYQGDERCVGDRAGTLVDVPLVVPGFQIAFRQTAGFTPLLLPITPSFPIKVVRGPTESIWVMDAGDFLSTSLSTPSTRGKVFRVESGSLGVVILLQ